MRALLSVYDKTGLQELAAGLVSLGAEIISTGGTQRYLSERGIAVTAVSDVTGFPEILDGRVKTLHPAIHGGLLARSDMPDHRMQLEATGITPIDLVAVNLYPFEATVAAPGCTLYDALEQIDIGGPAMIRAAAKNHPAVIVLTDPDDYDLTLHAIATVGVNAEKRRALAARAFQHVSTYDALVAEYLRGDDPSFPDEITIPGRLAETLRYGENPHQRAAAYVVPSTTGTSVGVLAGRQLHGKGLSYNNILDANAALSAVQGLAGTACCIVKHTVPCGLAIGASAGIAYANAFAGDPVSAFGGIVALNQPVDLKTATAMADVFYEVIVAPGFAPDALNVLRRKKNVRLMQVPPDALQRTPRLEVRSVIGGLLLQEADSLPDPETEWRTVTEVEVEPSRLDDLRLAWHACRFVKSNAIVLVRDRAVVGVGPGQPNRVDSVRIAVTRAGDRAAGSVLASDAFFPFADGVEAALAAGISAIVQPGGSVRDADAVAACNNIGVPMVFTGRRHFLH